MVGGDPGTMVKARYIIYIFHQRESFCFEGGDGKTGTRKRRRFRNCCSWTLG